MNYLLLLSFILIQANLAQANEYNLLLDRVESSFQELNTVIMNHDSIRNTMREKKDSSKSFKRIEEITHLDCRLKVYYHYFFKSYGDHGLIKTERTYSYDETIDFKKINWSDIALIRRGSEIVPIHLFSGKTLFSLGLGKENFNEDDATLFWNSLREFSDSCQQFKKALAF